MMFLDGMEREAIVPLPPVVPNPLVTLNHDARDPHLLEARRNL